MRQFYYKVRQVLQSAMIITKCDRTLVDKSNCGLFQALGQWGQAKKVGAGREGSGKKRSEHGKESL